MKNFLGIEVNGKMYRLSIDEIKYYKLDGLTITIICGYESFTINGKTREIAEGILKSFDDVLFNEGKIITIT
jgi:hypothetical protein